VITEINKILLVIIIDRSNESGSEIDAPAASACIYADPGGGATQAQIIQVQTNPEAAIIQVQKPTLGCSSMLAAAP